MIYFLRGGVDDELWRISWEMCVCEVGVEVRDLMVQVNDKEVRWVR